IRPGTARHAGLLPGHEFEGAMRSEMQHCMGAEILVEPAVEGGKRVGRSEALLEQKPHGVAFVAEGRLHTDENVAEALPEHEDRAAVGLMLAGRTPPLRFDLGEMALAAHMIVDGNAGMHIRAGAEARRVATE